MGKIQVYWTEETGRIYRNGNHPIPLDEARKKMASGRYSGAEMSWTGVIPVNIYQELVAEVSDWNLRIFRGCKNTSLSRCHEFCSMYCEQ